jgi:hypothetical protein
MTLLLCSVGQVSVYVTDAAATRSGKRLRDNLERFDIVDAPAKLSPIISETIRLLLPTNADASLRIFLRQRTYNSDGVAYNYPYVNRERQSDGTFEVNLCIQQTRLWCQNVFQFAHEFCHVLCVPPFGAERSSLSIRYKHANQWFEEAICHAASLHALLSFDHAISMQCYREPTVFATYALHADVPDALAADVTLSEWYWHNRWQLRSVQHVDEQQQRKQQAVVSRWLLLNVGMTKLLECLRYLNNNIEAHPVQPSNDNQTTTMTITEQPAVTKDVRRPKRQQLSLRRYLYRWLKACETAEQRQTVRLVYNAFKPFPLDHDRELPHETNVFGKPKCFDVSRIHNTNC